MVQWPNWDATTWATVSVAFFALVQIGQTFVKEFFESRRRRKLSEVRAGIVSETLSRTLHHWASLWPGYHEPGLAYHEWYKKFEPEFTEVDGLLLRLADEVVNLKRGTAARALKTVSHTREDAWRLETQDMARLSSPLPCLWRTDLNPPLTNAPIGRHNRNCFCWMGAFA
jgi:hypothetical protein